MKTEHHFDWKGFFFASRLITLLLGVALGANFAISYFSPEQSQQTPLAIQARNEEKIVADAVVSPRIINGLTITDAVPKEGKFVAADLVAMKIYLYENGVRLKELSIVSKGKPGTPWETPSGLYTIRGKTETHFSTIGKVYMPYSMVFFGNYFIHGWPYYPDGTEVPLSYSGGCIRLSTADAAEVFEFVKIGTKLFVYDQGGVVPPHSLKLADIVPPPVTAGAYLVADLGSGEVLAERGTGQRYPIASITKLMTALVANETISFDKLITIGDGALLHATTTSYQTFTIEELLYPLLMESNNEIAKEIASYYGTRGFIGWMNSTAESLGMNNTHFTDASGADAGNVSTADDLFRLASYLANKKSFVLKVSRTPTYDVVSEEGSVYSVKNFNHFADSPAFIGGKTGHTTPAKDTMLSVFKVKAGAVEHRVVVIVLNSEDRAADTAHLVNWLAKATLPDPRQDSVGCTNCAQTIERRVIEL